MVIPLNSGMIPQQGLGGPTPFCQAMRPWFLAVVLLQGVVGFWRLFVMLDIWGGFYSGIIVGLGTYAYHQDMHISFVCYYGLGNLVNGILDSVRLLDNRVHSFMPLFAPELGFAYNMSGMVQLLIPGAAILAAFVSYQIYKDYTCGPRAGGYLGWSVQAPSYGAAKNARSSSSAQSASRFEAFSGSGQRLGGDV